MKKWKALSFKREYPLAEGREGNDFFVPLTEGVPRLGRGGGGRLSKPLASPRLRSQSERSHPSP